MPLERNWHFPGHWWGNRRDRDFHLINGISTSSTTMSWEWENHLSTLSGSAHPSPRKDMHLRRYYPSTAFLKWNKGKVLLKKALLFIFSIERNARGGSISCLLAEDLISIFRHSGLSSSVTESCGDRGYWVKVPRQKFNSNKNLNWKKSWQWALLTCRDSPKLSMIEKWCEKAPLGKRL